VSLKGFDLLAAVMEDILKLDVNFVMLASGDKELEKKFEQIQKKFPNRFSLILGYNDELAHMIEAGCDIFVMPSKYEPCGLNQMYSMRYGTVPIVHATGGLDDTVEDYAGNGKGNGFKFEKYDTKELLKTIQRALKLLQQQPMSGKNNEERHAA